MNFKCPFHNDNNASFSIKKKIFFCYGCNKKGKFNLKFKKLKNFDIFFNCETLLIAKNNLLYNKNYWLNYLIKRNISVKTLIKFNLGFLNLNFKYKIKKIIINKLIFPIINEIGILSGIGLKPKSGKTKYINLYKFNFNKNDLIYGMYESIDNYFVIVVEGYFDLLTLYENNIYNVISILGSNINEKQIFKILKKFKKIYFCFDGDQSGYNAILKLFFFKKKYNLKNIFFKCLPLNYDPDSYINKFGIKEFLNFIL